VYESTLGVRVIKKTCVSLNSRLESNKEEEDLPGGGAFERVNDALPYRSFNRNLILKQPQPYPSNRKRILPTAILSGADLPGSGAFESVDDALPPDERHLHVEVALRGLFGYVTGYEPCPVGNRS